MGWNWQLHACLWQYAEKHNSVTFICKFVAIYINIEIHIKQSSQDFIDLKQIVI